MAKEMVRKQSLSHDEAAAVMAVFEREYGERKFGKTFSLYDALKVCARKAGVDPALVSRHALLHAGFDISRPSAPSDEDTPVTMSFVATVAIKKELEEWAAAEHRSFSSLMRHVILEPALNKHLESGSPCP